MLDILKEKLSKYNSNEEKYNALREQIQLIILKIIDEKGYFRQIAFLGGTALRILYDLKRFSEDLDFSLIDNNNYSFKTIINTLERELNAYGFQASTRFKEDKTVASAFIKFESLLFALGLSNNKDKKLLIKLEVDQNPPQGYKTEFTMVNADYLISINHFDLPSLFAGKLHAILCRKYAKGRDYYDFLWYLSKKVQPNYELLQNSITQTENKKTSLNRKILIENLVTRFNKIDFDQIAQDVAPFLEDPRELRHFKHDIFVKMAKEMK